MYTTKTVIIDLSKLKKLSETLVNLTKEKNKFNKEEIKEIEEFNNFVNNHKEDYQCLNKNKFIILSEIYNDIDENKIKNYKDYESLLNNILSDKNITLLKNDNTTPSILKNSETTEKNESSAFYLIPKKFIKAHGGNPKDSFKICSLVKKYCESNSKELYKNFNKIIKNEYDHETIELKCFMNDATIDKCYIELFKQYDNDIKSVIVQNMRLRNDTNIPLRYMFYEIVIRIINETK